MQDLDTKKAQSELNRKAQADLRRKNLTAWMEKYEINKTELSRRCNFQRASASNLFNPLRFFGEKLARSIEKSMGMPEMYLDSDSTRPQVVVEWSKPDDLQPDVYALVPRLSVQLSAGDGCHSDLETELPPLAFRREWLQKKNVTSKNNLRVVSVHGDSMQDYLQDGDVVLLDTGQTSIKDGSVYALRLSDELKIKRLFKKFDGSISISSDNDKYPVETLSPAQAEHLQVIGLAIWRSG